MPNYRANTSIARPIMSNIRLNQTAYLVRAFGKGRRDHNSKKASSYNGQQQREEEEEAECRRHAQCDTGATEAKLARLPDL
ncbi:hypothetical protein FOXB_12127 [Fusarium oxysporum f. sp. conglutinans Fo5176]|uniref:Uncharacterized protein n=1 Tax=Fusarium oxysporum (strain Fo5176) TaxID=660025 RepID=F9G0E5_FUSOF|nr:hypothetical protein FOXB_12127 [Fusarium oxysporum f. sp. conglutinans Fo5176]